MNLAGGLTLYRLPDLFIGWKEKLMQSKMELIGCLEVEKGEFGDDENS